MRCDQKYRGDLVNKIEFPIQRYCSNTKYSSNRKVSLQVQWLTATKGTWNVWTYLLPKEVCRNRVQRIGTQLVVSLHSLGHIQVIKNKEMNHIIPWKFWCHCHVKVGHLQEIKLHSPLNSNILTFTHTILPAQVKDLFHFSFPCYTQPLSFPPCPHESFKYFYILNQWKTGEGCDIDVPLTLLHGRKMASNGLWNLSHGIDQISSKELCGLQFSTR